MARDLDGYVVPGSDGKQVRRTTWHPYGLELERRPLGHRCACPCRIAHPNYLADVCDQDAQQAVAEVAIWQQLQETRILPLCAVCAAAQLHGRWQDAEADVAAWRHAEKAPVSVATLVVVIAIIFGSWPVAGIAGGLILSTGVLSFAHDRARKRRAR